MKNTIKKFTNKNKKIKKSNYNKVNNSMFNKFKYFNKFK